MARTETFSQNILKISCRMRGVNRGENAELHRLIATTIGKGEEMRFLELPALQKDFKARGGTLGDADCVPTWILDKHLGLETSG